MGLNNHTLVVLLVTVVRKYRKNVVSVSKRSQVWACRVMEEFVHKIPRFYLR